MGNVLRITDNWWKEIFDGRYVTTVLREIPHSTTEAEARFVMNALHLPKGARILDVACGAGRHAIAWAQEGYRVTGLEYSPILLRLAQNEAAARSLPLTLIRADMRRFKIHQQTNAAVCMFTSFGYFKNERDHQLALQCIAQSLKRGGLFLLDLANPFHVIDCIFKGDVWTFRKGETSARFVTKLRSGIPLTTSSFNPTTMRWIMVRKWRERRRLYRYSASVRLFTLPELHHLFAHAGLTIKKTWGDFDGSPYQWSSRRLIILARKTSRKPK